jgi:signal transduction histidine kinase
MKLKISLVQKVFISLFIIFVIAGFLLSFIVSRELKNVFLAQQQKNVVEFVLKQSNQRLSVADFKTADYASVALHFDRLFQEIKTEEIIRIKVYNSEGRVIFSDKKELIGQKLFQNEEDELNNILSGQVVADITAPIKTENVYEKGYKQLMEIYVPITFAGSKEVVGIIEIYFNLDFLSQKIQETQLRFIYAIILIFAILFAILFLIVRGASRKLIEQSLRLEEDIKKEKEYSSLKDEFISMASHQLRTPSSSIKWFLELLQGGDFGRLETKQLEIIKDIHESNEKMINIINTLLIISKIKPDFFDQDQTYNSPEEITQTVINQLKEKLARKNINLEINIGKALLKIKSRKEALIIVVENLIDNAIDYTPPGGKILIDLLMDNNNLLFRIKDTGIGIPKSEQIKIFGKFFRAQNAIEQKNVGSGLGLCIVKKIIDGFHGQIWFESEEGKGTTFYFTLPLKR